MTATKDIRTRIATLLDTDMSTVSGTTKTVLNRLNKGKIADYAGYIFKVYMRSSNLANDGRLIQEGHSWLIELHSPIVGLQWESQKEDDMYDYYDLVVQLFAVNSVLRLADGTKLNTVSEAKLSAGTFTWGDSSLDGQARYKLSFSLSFVKRTPCVSS